LKQYSSLVRRLAHQMIAKLPANVEIDDLIQVGMIGLTDALSRFDAAQGVQFETFATQRIRGAMLDELRGNDYLSRGTRKQQRTIESAVHKLEQRLGRAPVESEIAVEMEMSLVEYQELLGRVRGTQLVYLEDMAGAEGDNDFLDRHVADEGSNPMAQLQDHRMRTALINILTNARHAVQGAGTRRGGSSMDDRRGGSLDPPGTVAVANRPGVIVKTRYTAGRVLVTVQDCGTGISADDMSHIFDPYFTTRRKGTGLGLPIAKTIIEGLGGSIAVASTLGSGTTITLDLPLDAEALA
jgi:RNA polymerase sigma factor for flagellar operon FliA